MNPTTNSAAAPPERNGSCSAASIRASASNTVLER